MKVIVCGDRNWGDFEIVLDRLSKFPLGTIVIHGDCRGADKMAGSAADLLGFEVRKYPADWEKHGKAAGVIRNQEMLDVEDPDIVIAFHEDIKRSRGTAHMLRISKKAGKETELIDGK